MPTPILTTKFFIPQARADSICRTRLFEKINQGLNRSRVLISAPAGCGNTSLLPSWVHQNAVPTAWLSLDQSDNHPALLLRWIPLYPPKQRKKH